ncbi:MAG: tail fiber domain-containing protein [Sediminibacterium sp.]|nr:tail fiber domain-containing protein [Sediminibacterium sp.]
MTTTPFINYGCVLAVMAIIGSTEIFNAQNASYDLNSIPVTGNNNSIFGAGSFGLNTTGSYNSTLGFYVLPNNTTGTANNAIGYGTLASNTTGGFNSVIGIKCAASNVGGSYNSVLGSYAFNANTTGNYNTSIGAYSNMSAGTFTNATALGYNAVTNASNRLWLGNAVTTVWTTNSYNVSDGRFKKNISAAPVKGLEFIKRLRPVTYNFDAKALTEHLTQGMSEEMKKQYLSVDFNSTESLQQTGFIAQEVEEAAKAAGYNFSGVHKPSDKYDTYGVSYYQFVVPLVKAVQEQQQMIDEQKAVNEKLMQQVAEQQKAIEALLNTSATAKKALQNETPASFSMDQNEPNPFTLETTVKYNLPKDIANAYLAVYDLSGKQLTTFPITQKGESAMVISSDKLASGIYIYSIIGDGKVLDTKRMVVTGK